MERGLVIHGRNSHDAAAARCQWFGAAAELAASSRWQACNAVSHPFRYVEQRLCPDTETQIAETTTTTFPLAGKPFSSYRIVAVDAEGRVSGPSRLVRYEPATRVVHEISPDGYILRPCSPNPFNGVTRIDYFLPRPSNVKLDIFNYWGQNVKNVLDERQPEGTHAILFHADQLPSGLYHARLEFGFYQQMRRVTLIR